MDASCRHITGMPVCCTALPRARPQNGEVAAWGAAHALDPGARRQRCVTPRKRANARRLCAWDAICRASGRAYLRDTPHGATHELSGVHSQTGAIPSCAPTPACLPPTPANSLQRPPLQGARKAMAWHTALPDPRLTTATYTRPLGEHAAGRRRCAAPRASAACSGAARGGRNVRPEDA